METSEIHIPVLLEEVLSFVKIEKMTYVDMTLGRAGHASAILSKIKKGSSFYGIDRDEEALRESKKRLSPFEDTMQLHFVKAPYTEGLRLLKESHVDGADFILMDIGVSSPQFDNPERGFSYRYDAPLDMRMDQSQSLTAKKVVNEYDERQLLHVFRDLGECAYAYPVTKAILKKREEKPIETTFELVDIIKSVLPEKELRKKGHPAKQYFLGLRYEVNGEMDELETGVQEALSFLKKEGRLVVITFNSEEDRIVKHLFKNASESVKSDKYHPLLEEKKPSFHLLTRKPITPSEEEIERNNRSKPSILRAIERR